VIRTVDNEYHFARNRLNPWSRLILATVIPSRMVKKFQALYRIRRFITALKKLASLRIWNQTNSVQIHFNFIIPSMHRFSRCTLSNSFSNENTALTSGLCQTSHTTLSYLVNLTMYLVTCTSSRYPHCAIFFDPIFMYVPCILCLFIYFNQQC
jgi:hypothetical protein